MDGLITMGGMRSQQVLRKLIEGRLTFEPREDAAGRFYAFSGVGTVAKLLAGLVPQNVASPTGSGDLYRVRIVGKVRRRAA